MRYDTHTHMSLGAKGLITHDATRRRMGRRWYNSTHSLPRPLYMAMTGRLHAPTHHPPQGKIRLPQIGGEHWGGISNWTMW